MRAWIVGFIGLAIATGSSHAVAAIAFDFSSASEDPDFAGTTIGFQFTALDAISVTDLGYYDGGNGLTFSHDVGLWDSSQNLLASATVTPTSSADSVFRFESITPVPLTAGETYFVAGTHTDPADPYAYSAVNPVVGPEISYDDDAYANSGTLTFPSLSVAGWGSLTSSGWFGGNFKYTSTPSVPEPSGLIIWSLTGSLASILTWRRKRRR